MATRVKAPFKLAVFVGLVVLFVVGIKSLMYHGYIRRPDVLKSLVPTQTDTIEAEVLQHSTDVKTVPLPKPTITQNTGPTIRYLLWFWNAQFGVVFANGGPTTTQGSLVEKQGIKLQLERQDDPEQMRNELATFATALSKGTPQPNVGAHFVAIMGDGAAAFLAPLNERLAKLGDEYIAEVVGIGGYSRGEDQVMGLPEHKTNPQSMRGSLYAGVLRDGDWNLLMRYANINKIPVNPDETTYDPDAINLLATSTYIEASQRYIAGYCEERPRTDKPGVRHKACVNGVFTWTPGDVMIADSRGGLVTLISTKSALFQMPNTIIGIKRWNAENRDKVAGMLAAFSQGADQVRTNPAAFRKAAEISAIVYKEQDADYCMRYFKGVTKKDIQGNTVELGGSAVANIADAMQAFGLTGGPNLFRITYETWGNAVVQQYPNLMKSFPPIEQVLNTQYVQLAAAKLNQAETLPAETQTYSATAPLTEIIGRRDYSINFRTGSAEILPNSFSVLNEIADDLNTSNTQVIVHGHTDNTGTAAGNERLSELRARSVKQYLMSKGGSYIPDTRVKVVAHGQNEPVADNATETGRAKNRRVEVVLGR